MSGIPFFISYIFVAGIVMTNVVVAILLEKYLQATQEHEKGEKAEADALALEEMEVDEDDDSGGLPVTGSSTAEELIAVKTTDLVRTHSCMPHDCAHVLVYVMYESCLFSYVCDDHVLMIFCRRLSLPVASRRKCYSSCLGLTCSEWRKIYGSQKRARA
jgi:hypothetical protein